MDIMLRWTALLAIMDLQIKTAMKYYFISSRQAVIKKADTFKCCQGYGGTGTLIHCWWDYKTVWPLR